MDIGSTFLLAIVLFICGVIIKSKTTVDFNGLVAALATLTFVIPFFIALFNIISNPADSAVVSDNISYFIESFVNYLPGAIIGDIAAMLVSPFID